MPRRLRRYGPCILFSMNVAIRHRTTDEVIARYEVHKAGEGTPPPENEYFDAAWQRAVADGLVEADDRSLYEFQLQLPKTIYESSR